MSTRSKESSPGKKQRKIHQDTVFNRILEGVSRPVSQSSSHTRSRRGSRLGSNTSEAGKSTVIQQEANELARAYKKWIESHFMMHTACAKPQADARNKKKCVCGRDFAIWGHHTCPKEKKDAPAVKWSLDSCTHVPTTSYGLVNFKEVPLQHIQYTLSKCIVSHTGISIAAFTSDCIHFSQFQ